MERKNTIINRIKRFDDINTGKMLNYPSKWYKILTITTSFVIFISALTISASFYNNTNILKSIFAVFYIIVVLSAFLYANYTLVYKPIRFYEKKYGGTGMGDKHLKKWEGEK